MLTRPRIKKTVEVLDTFLFGIDGFANSMRYVVEIDSASDLTAAILFSFSQPVKPDINVRITKDVRGHHPDILFPCRRIKLPYAPVQLIWRVFFQGVIIPEETESETTLLTVLPIKARTNATMPDSFLLEINYANAGQVSFFKTFLHPAPVLMHILCI